MKVWTSTLARPVASLWLTAGVAALFAAWLLSTFVDTLHAHLRRGDELRRAQLAAAGRTVVQAAPVDLGEARVAQLKLR